MEQESQCHYDGRRNGQVGLDVLFHFRRADVHFDVGGVHFVLGFLGDCVVLLLLVRSQAVGGAEERVHDLVDDGHQYLGCADDDSC